MDRCLQVQVVVVGAVDLLLFSGLPEFFLSLRFFVKSMLVNFVAPHNTLWKFYDFPVSDFT